MWKIEMVLHHKKEHNFMDGLIFWSFLIEIKYLIKLKSFRLLKKKIIKTTKNNIILYYYNKINFNYN